MPLNFDDAAAFSGTEPEVKRQRTKISANLEAVLKEEGAEHLGSVVDAIYGQESGRGANSKTSVDGARGGMQIIPDTFRRLAKPGESIDNPDDNLRVGVRYIKQLGDKFGNDPARIAAGYFSGEGNVSAAGDQPFKQDRSDGNGKRVSSYVQDVLGRVGDAVVPSAQAKEADLGQLSLFKGSGADDKLSQLSIFKQADAPSSATAPGKAESASALDTAKDLAGRAPDLIKGIGSRMLEPFQPKKPLMAGAENDPAPARSVEETGGVPLQSERLQQFRSIARLQPDTAAKIAARDDWSGQAMRAVLGEQKAQTERLVRGENIYAPNKLDMEQRATLPRTASLSEGGEDNAKIAYNQAGPVGKNLALVSQGVGQGLLGIQDGVLGASQAALRLVGAEGVADTIQGRQEELKRRSSNLDLPRSAEYGAKMVQGAINSITQNVPGLLTGAEAPALAAMGLQSFGQEYAAGRSAGMTDAEATVRAGIYGAAEILGERFGLGDQLKGLKAAAAGRPTSELIDFFGKALTKEIPGEQLTSAIEFAADKYLPQGMNKQATLDDYLRVVADTTVQTILQGGLMMGGGAAIGKTAEAAQQAFPHATLGRALREAVEAGQFDPAATDRAARLALDPNADARTELVPEARGFAPTPKQTVNTVPVAGDDPLAGAPVTNPVAGELAQIEGVADEQSSTATSNEDSRPGISPAGGQGGAEEAGQQGSAGPAREAGVEQGAQAGRGVTLAGLPIEQHTPASLNVLAAAHPDPAVREQAAQARSSQPNTYSVVTQTEQGPVESKIDSALKGQINDASIQALVRGNGGRPLELSTPESVRVFHVVGAGADREVGAADFSAAINAISGRNVIVARGADFRGVVVDGRSIILSQQQGAEGLKAVAFHELRHALVEDHPDLSALWRGAVQQHMDTSDAALLHFLTYKYQDPAASPERVAAMRSKGRTDEQILNAVLARHAQAQSYEDAGRGSRRDWVLEELEADALGDATNRDGVIHKALDYMAKVDIGLVKQFAQFIQGVLKRMGQGFGSEAYRKGSTEAEIRAHLEALDQAAAEVLGRYASRTQNQKRMQSATPAELLLIKKSHPDEVVRDMAAAALKQRETEEAYRQREQQKEGEKQLFKQRDAEARFERADAEAKAAGTDEPVPSAMQQALAGAKRDVQALRRELAKEMKKAAATARALAQVRQDILADNEEGRFSPKRPGSDIGHKRTKDGDYVGAPAGMTPAKLGALRTRLKGLALEGEPGRFWYEESSDLILAAAEGDKALAEKLAGLLAIYSPQATVSANTSMGLKALYQWMNGEPIRVRFAHQDRKAQAWMDGTIAEEDALQIKTGNFFKNLMRKIDEERYGFDQQGATIDMWMARVFGYGSKAIGSEARYYFAERETKRLAEELGWEPQQVQAALWVAIKSRIEAIADQAREVGKKKGWVERKVVKSGGKENISWPPLAEHREQYEGLILKMALAQDPDPSGLLKASYHFGTALRERVGQISWEAMPGKTTGVLPGIFNAPLEQQTEYLVAMDRALRDENGQDLIAKKLGLPVVGTAMGPSAWQMNVGAGAQTEVAIATDRDQGNKKVSVTRPARELLNTYAAIRGYVLAQEAVVWHYPIYGAAKKDANGIQLDFGRDPTHDEIVSLYNAIHAESGRDDWAPAYVPGVGVRVLNFSDVPNTEFHALIKKAAAALPGDVTIHTDVFQSDGDYISNDWKEKPNGEDYRSRIGGSGRPDLQGWVESELRPRAERINQEFADKYGWGNPRFSPSRAGAGSAGDLRPAGERAAGLPPSYGRAKPEAVGVRGVHYSQQVRQVLSGAMYGTGLKGQEGARLSDPANRDIRSRVFFYVDEGQGVFPEAGVGAQAHDVQLENLYDLATDPLNLWRQGSDASARERAIKEAGFDGYYARGVFGRQGVAVLIGDHSVPVRSLGTGYKGGDAKPAAPAKPPANDDAAKVEGSRILPMGQMSGAEWKRLMPAVLPGVDVSMLDDAKAYYKDQVVQAMREAPAPRLSPVRSNTQRQYIEENFLDILSSLEDAGLVEINC